MPWMVLFCDEFEAEFQALAEGLQDELLAHALLLQEFGPNLGRPTVDTLRGSRHPNMKEMRFDWNSEVWRVAFAFDPRRQAILLTAANKTGVNQRRFYEKLIDIADKRFDRHLNLFGTRRRHKSKRGRHGKKT